MPAHAYRDTHLDADAPTPVTNPDGDTDPDADACGRLRRTSSKDSSIRMSASGR